MCVSLRISLVVLTVLMAPLVSRAATPEEIQNAIDKADQYLYSQQKNGNWETFRRQKKIASPAQDQPGGMTATAVYALLTSGEAPDKKKLAPAIDYLKKTELFGTYSVGIRCQIWHLLPPADDVKALIQRDSALLISKLHQDTGMYDYILNTPAKIPDFSASQYGIQAVRACAQEGIEVPTEYWASIDQTWRAAQRPDGSWNFSNKVAKDDSRGHGKHHKTSVVDGFESDQPVTPSSVVPAPGPVQPKANIDELRTLPMTAAAVANLFMSQDQLNMGVSPACKGNITDPNIDKGIAWLGNHFDELFTSKYRYYALYGIEELGAASGRKYIGNTDWYKLGVDYLVKNQKANGSWENGVPDTSFAILFLARGSAPIGISKLQYLASPQDQTTEGDWNQRPRDLANFTNWVTRQVELDRLLNWQVVNLDAPVDDLHETAALYIAGDKALNFSLEHKRKIRSFVEQGGLIIFNADCGKAEFSDSVKQLAAELFPKIGEFRELPSDHPILRGEQFLASDWKNPPTVLGLTNGVRELMLLLPKADLSRSFQAQLSTSHSADFELAANILLYASDKKNIREKGESYIIQPNPKVQDTRSFKVGRIQYDGNWDPEPGGWRRLAAFMHNNDQLGLETVPVTLGVNTSLDQYKVLHLTGTGHFKIDPSDWVQLRAYVENGGTLIIDAAGGSTPFAEDARSQLNVAFYDTASQLDSPLRLTNDLYTQVGGRIDEIGYRAFARKKLVEHLHQPRIRGIRFGDRMGVFFSAEDISAGLVGEPVDGILGYDPDSATSLMEHMILYAETGGKPSPTTQP